MGLVESIIHYNSSLDSISDLKDMFIGLQPVRLETYLHDPDTKRRFISIFKLYITEILKSGELSIEAENKVHILQQIMGLSQKVSSAIISDLISKAYRKELHAKYISRKFETAESKASIINQICYCLNLSPIIAQKINISIFSQKLHQMIEKKSLNDLDEIEIEKLRVTLCIQDDKGRKILANFLGKCYEKRVNETLKVGINKSYANN